FGAHDRADPVGHGELAAWVGRVDPVRQGRHGRRHVRGGPAGYLREGGRPGLGGRAGGVRGHAGAAGQAVDGRGPRVLDRGGEPAFLARTVAVPGGAPDAVQVPAQVAEHLLAEPVAVAGGPGRVVLVAVTFDAQGVHAGMAGVVDADVDAVPGGADLRGKHVSPGADDVDDRLHER